MLKKSDKLLNKLKSLPNRPGVYFHKNKSDEIIYVGKAAVLKNRVRQYFQTKKDTDLKTKALVDEIHDTDWVETDSEVDALFLEAEMIKRYMPKFNILLRDDKSLTYIRIDIKSARPYVSYTRHPLDDGAEYFGPYYNSFAIKKAMRYLRKVFPYYIKQPKPNSKTSDLDDHLGLSPANLSDKQYHEVLNNLIKYIKGNRIYIIDDLKKRMNELAKSQEYEQATIVRNQLSNLLELKRRIIFSDKEFLDISKDVALSELVEILNLEIIPKRIEGFDISHMSGTNVVSSMVVFKNGVSSRKDYRKFKIKIDKNDDFYNMNETLIRRLSDKNLNSWGRPDLILIDGGKGQLDSALEARKKLGQAKITFVGLAKREEQIIVKDVDINLKNIKKYNGYIERSENFVTINLPKNDNLIKLFQRIRDESHRFAVSYHSQIKLKKQSSSIFDDIDGIGPKTKMKLLRHFGSVKKISESSESEIAKIIGSKKAKLVSNHLKAL